MDVNMKIPIPDDRFGEFIDCGNSNQLPYYITSEKIRDWLSKMPGTCIVKFNQFDACDDPETILDFSDTATAILFKVTWL